MTASTIPQGQFALAGPSGKPDAARLPVRGDLAHIGLAGRYFVPHYVPQPHKVRDGGATLLASARPDAAPVAELESGARFELLDISGMWGWGGCGIEGPSGYVRLDRLEKEPDA